MRIYIKKFHLILDVDLPIEDFDVFNGSHSLGVKVVKACFQVWEKRLHDRPVMRRSLRDCPWLEVLSKEEDIKLEEAGDKSVFAFRTQGAAAGKVLEPPISSYITNFTCFKEKVPGVREVLKSLDFSKVANLVAATPAMGGSEVYYALEAYYSGDQEELKKILRL